MEDHFNDTAPQEDRPEEQGVNAPKRKPILFIVIMLALTIAVVLIVLFFNKHRDISNTSETINSSSGITKSTPRYQEKPGLNYDDKYPPALLSEAEFMGMVVRYFVYNDDFKGDRPDYWGVMVGDGVGEEDYCYFVTSRDKINNQKPRQISKAVASCLHGLELNLPDEDSNRWESFEYGVAMAAFAEEYAREYEKSCNLFSVFGWYHTEEIASEENCTIPNPVTVAISVFES